MSELDWSTVKDRAAGRMFQTLLGCGWGRVVSTRDDIEPCEHPAERIIVLHDGPRTFDVWLCASHVDRIQQEMTPHAD